MERAIGGFAEALNSRRYWPDYDKPQRPITIETRFFENDKLCYVDVSIHAPASMPPECIIDRASEELLNKGIEITEWDDGKW